MNLITHEKHESYHDQWFEKDSASVLGNLRPTKYFYLDNVLAIPDADLWLAGEPLRSVHWTLRKETFDTLIRESAMDVDYANLASLKNWEPA